MTKPYNVIKDFNISTRINEGLTSLNMTLVTPLDPTTYVTGSTFEFIITEPTLEEEYIGVEGVVETVSRDAKNGNKIYGISGRDKGRLLNKQKFDLDSNTETPSTYTTMELLEMILVDSGIVIGRGQVALSEIIIFTTDSEADNSYSGSFGTKTAAINELFKKYVELSNAKGFRWYIDYAGYLRWFEINSDRTGKKYIFEDDETVINFDVKEDSTNVLNTFTGFYGTEDDKTSVTVSDAASIAQYGKCVADPISDTKMDQAQMTAKLNAELAQKKDPIYSGTITFEGFLHIEMGTQIIFPNDPFYSEIYFTVTDIRRQGNPTQRITTCNVTSDESSISIPNEFDVIRATARKEVKDNLAVVGEVVSIGTGDRLEVQIQSTKSKGSIVDARNVGGFFND